MKDLLDKLSSYNLFNYLLPGTLFAAAAEHISDYSFHRGDLIIDLFTYYFIGLVISRIGSLVVEPVLKKTGFVKFASYSAYVKASSLDEHIAILSEQNNMFRTLCALFLALPAFRALDAIGRYFGVGPVLGSLIAFGLLSALFAFAYRKQTQFVKKRVEARTE
jgi:hypothetical protein